MAKKICISVFSSSLLFLALSLFISSFIPNFCIGKPIGTQKLSSFEKNRRKKMSVAIHLKLVQSIYIFGSFFIQTAQTHIRWHNCAIWKESALFGNAYSRLLSFMDKPVSKFYSRLLSFRDKPVSKFFAVVSVKNRKQNKISKSSQTKT